MQRDEGLFLHILIAAKHAVDLVANMSFEEFQDHESVPGAVLWDIQIIGEACRKVSESTKEFYENIPWFEMTGMRNRLVHDYSRINMKRVWETVTDDLPKLIEQIQPLVPPE